MTVAGNKRELIRPAEYARRRGVSRASVTRAIRRCQIPLVDGRLDPLVADTLWEARTDPVQSARALGQQRRDQAPAVPQDDPAARENWRERQARADALRAELELRKASGDLVERTLAEREIGRRLASMKVQFDALPDRAAAALGVNDEHRRKVRQFLRDELAQICLDAVQLGLPRAA